MTDRQPAGAAGSGTHVSRRAALMMAAGCLASGLLPAAAASAAGAGRPLDHLLGLSSGRSIGSAFFLMPGLAVTNAHVVAGLRAGAAVTITDRAGRRAARARLIAASDSMDMAVIAAPEGFLAPVARADAPQRRGLAVRAAGVDPLSQRGAGLELQGRVAAVDLDLPRYGRGLLVRLPGVRRGFSGGPVLDADGRFVGMLTSIRAAPGTSSRRMAFAPLRLHEADEAFVLPAAQIRREAGRLAGASGA